MDASKATSPTNGASEDTSDSIYARNRAIYEASLAQQQQAVNSNSNSLQNGNGSSSTDNTSEKQARPREDDDDENATSPGGSSIQPPAKKKLIRAGDLAAAAGAASPGLPSPAPTPASDAGSASTQAAAPPASAGESMREKIARASRSTSGTPFVAQVQYSPPPPQQPALSPTAAATATAAAPGGGSMSPTGTASTMSNLDQVIEVNTLAFVAKNPQIDPNHVRQALKHSKGAFDQNFNTAIQLLIAQSASKQQNNQQQSQQQATLGAAQNAFSPAARYPGQQVNPTPPPSQGHFPGQQQPSAAMNGAQAQGQMRNFPGSKMSPPVQQPPLHPHQMAGPGQRPVVGNQASIINGQSAAAMLPQPGSVPMPSAPPPPILVGTHRAIGFSALQILPVTQHKQYYQLAPNQQTDYSMQVFKSLPAEQQAELTAEWRRSEALRQQWQQYYAANPSAAPGANMARPGPGGQIVIPPRGMPGGPGNPYIPYAAHQPTNRQQTVQQRFPGQNPVFRVGANDAAAKGAAGAGPAAGVQGHHQALPPNHPEYAWFHNEQTRLLAEMSPEARQAFHELSEPAQYDYVVASIRLKQDNAKRQAQSQRQQQQKVMAATAKAARSGGAGAQQNQHQNAQANQQQKKKKKRKGGEESDDSEALGLHDEDTDDDRNDDDDVDGDDGSEAEADRENKALIWFNTVKPEEIMEMTGGQLMHLDGQLCEH